MSKKRILFINPFWFPYEGGIENVIKNVSHFLIDYPDVEEIGLLTSNGIYPTGKVKKPFKEVCKDENITVYRLNFLPKNIFFFNHLRNSGIYSNQISDVIKDFKPTVVQYMTDNWYIPNFLVYLASYSVAKQSFTPFYHDIEPSVPSLILRKINSYLLNRMQAVEVMTDSEKDKIIKFYKLRNKNILKFSLGLSYVASKIKKNKEYIQILSVGRIGAAKGQFELVKVFKELKKLTSRDVRLLLVGKDGGDLQLIRTFIKENKLTNCVEIKGFVSDDELKAIYQESDIFAHLTKYESFGLSFVDALANKMPCVCYAVGALPEIFSSGFLFAKPGSSKEILKSLLSLIKDDALRHKLGEEGFKDVSARFSWENTAKLYFDMFSELENLA